MAAVNLKTASIILDRAFTEAHIQDDDIGRRIDAILRGSHKTYRYILVTALLAKSSDEKIDILSLQKGDGSAGKYDARTLCHKVVVPFEKLRLPGSLGSSNEPFLNKPARFASLSMTNAVRPGNDARVLSELMDVLTGISDSAAAYKYLCSALAEMKEISREYVARFSVGDTLLDISEFSQLVLDYIYKMTDHTSNGEVCPLIVSQIEQMYWGKEYKVVAHKVNERGASSKEVGDVDVYKNKELVYSIEVKDRDFTQKDVCHAIAKFRAADLDTSLFIYDKHVSIEDEDGIYEFLRETGRLGHYCCLISILNYARLRICDIKSVTISDFLDGILKFAKAINANDETVTIIKDVATKIF